MFFLTGFFGVEFVYILLLKIFEVFVVEVFVVAFDDELEVVLV